MLRPRNKHVEVWLTTLGRKLTGIGGPSAPHVFEFVRRQGVFVKIIAHVTNELCSIVSVSAWGIQRVLAAQACLRCTRWELNRARRQMSS